MNEFDNIFMNLALKLSRRGLGRCAPNPNVGAVLVQYNDKPLVVGRGWTQPSGRPHAETVALEEAGGQAKGATLYVTLEPCSHYGKTPPCAEAIIKNSIRRVVYAADDPDERVAGRGVKMLQEAGVIVERASKAHQERAEWIMKGFLLRQTQNRPFVQVKLGVDAEYKVSRGDGEPVWITGEASRARAHLLRAQSDAILVGRGTAEADNPTLTCRLPGMNNRSPIRVLLDKSLQVPVTHNLFRTLDNAQLWVFCTEGADEERKVKLANAGARIMEAELDVASGALSINSILSQLAGHGVTRLMVEGGPRVVRSFWDNGKVDELVLFQSSRILGDQGKEAIENIGLPAALKSKDVFKSVERKVGEDCMKAYRIQVGS